jgi:hypothetical protein
MGVAVALGVAVVAATVAGAQPAAGGALPGAGEGAGEGKRKGPVPYTRVVEKEDGTLVLELSARTLVREGGAGPRVTLVGAVHIADAAFYATVQGILDGHGVVLFEGVKPPGAGRLAGLKDEAAREKATLRRMQFLMALCEQHREREGAFPSSGAELIEKGPKRWRSVLEGSVTDAWGRPLRFVVEGFERPGGEGVEGVERGTVLRIEGEGAAEAAGAKGTPLVVESKRLTDAAWGKRAGSAPPNLQAQMARALGLKFQLDQIDSGKPNWRSSDMSLDEVQAKFAERGADAGALLGMLDGSSFTGKLAGVLMGIVERVPTLSGMMKMMMVDVLARSEEMMARGTAPGAGGGLGGMDVRRMMEVIINDRNQVVVDDLRAIVENEPDVKSVAVFYGAGHMLDLEARLREQLGYRVDAETPEVWTAAITADPMSAGMSREQARSLRATIKAALDGQMRAGGAGAKGKPGQPKGAQPKPIRPTPIQPKPGAGRGKPEKR